MADGERGGGGGVSLCPPVVASARERRVGARCISLWDCDCDVRARGSGIVKAFDGGILLDPVR